MLIGKVKESQVEWIQFWLTYFLAKMFLVKFAGQNMDANIRLAFSRETLFDGIKNKLDKEPSDFAGIEIFKIT